MSTDEYKASDDPVGSSKGKDDGKSNLNVTSDGKDLALKEEDDLDDLDDLLDEFADDVLSKPPGSVAGTEQRTTEDSNRARPDEPLNAEFDNKVEDLLKDLQIEDPEARSQFEELMKQFGSEGKPDAEKQMGGKNFDSVMKETMERLKKSGATVDEQILKDQDNSNPEDILSQLLTGLDDSGGEGDLNMSKLLVDMLDQLSSKEVLYEPIKNLHQNFPEYLEKNKGIISEEDHHNYTKQYGISSEIIAIFDASDYDDEDKEKREKINSLLEELQELGQPPNELVGDSADFPGFDNFGGLMGGKGLDFNSNDLPKDMGKELEEGCKQT